MALKLKIQSDGTNKGTKILNADTGEALDKVTRLYWCMNADNAIATCTIVIADVAMEFDDSEGRAKISEEHVTPNVSK